MTTRKKRYYTYRRDHRDRHRNRHPATFREYIAKRHNMFKSQFGDVWLQKQHNNETKNKSQRVNSYRKDLRKMISVLDVAIDETRKHDTPIMDARHSYMKPIRNDLQLYLDELEK